MGLVSVWSYGMNGGKLVNSKSGKPIIVDLKMPGRNKSDAHRKTVITKAKRCQLEMWMLRQRSRIDRKLQGWLGCNVSRFKV